MTGCKPASFGTWLDITSAPKDGSHFLACDAHTPYGPQWTFNQRPPTVVHWWDGPEDGFYTSVNEVEHETPFSATHWCPLPPPPMIHAREYIGSINDIFSPALPGDVHPSNRLKE